MRTLCQLLRRGARVWGFRGNSLAGLAVLFSVAVIVPDLLGGTVITTNLPENVAIINISGTQDGAANYNGDQSLWYQPFNTGGAAGLLRYTVQPGTYTFRVIDPADAANLYPTLTSNELGQIYTAWTFNSPWATDYLVFDNSAATNTTVAQLFDGAFSNTNGTWLTYGNAAEAYGAATSNGWYDLVRPGPPLGRDGTNFSTTWTFSSAETLIFVVPDYDLGDNAGGVSVLAAQTGPGAPVLSIVGSAGTVTLFWPTNAVGFNLEQSPGLAPSAWSVVPNVPVIDTINYSVTLPVAADARFFRLHNP
jgi:hypothetical protein